MRVRSQASRTARRLLVAATAATALALAGCSGGTTGSTDPNAKVTLKVATFGDSSAVKAQVKQYEKEHPNVTVQVSTVASSEDSRTNLLTKLAAGSGLADVEQLEISWIGQLTRYKSRFAPLDVGKGGGFVPVQTTPVSLGGGKVWGLGIGTGPEAMCYREDMLKAAGMPTDTASLQKMFSTWPAYFAAGEQYAADGGKGKWYDDSYLTYNAQVEQIENPYETAKGEVAVDNPQLERIFKDTLAKAPKLSANLAPFSDDWNAGFGNGSFATFGCPSWQLASIQGNAKDVKDWRIADAFPGGGANLGGSFLSVPTQGRNQAAAAALAQYLSAPAQQVDAFKAGSAFPSRQQALDSPELRDVTNDYFGGAKIGTVFANRSAAAKTVMFKGPHYIAIDGAAFNAITRVETGKQSIDAAWQQFVKDSEASAK